MTCETPTIPSATADTVRETEKSKPLNRLAIVVRDDAYDRLYTPLTFAYVAARQGIQVDILFVLWSVQVLTEKGAAAVRIDGQHIADEEWFKERVRKDGDPLSIHEFIRLVKKTERVNLYGCQLAADTFDVTESDLIPEADGIVDSIWFLREKAVQADHCQYF